MKQRKRIWKSFAFFDRTGVVSFLERKARKGWVLEDTSGLRWTFRRGEPRVAHVWITYLPQDLYDPQPSQQLENMAELGAHTGWQLTVTTPFFQVYYNWEEEPFPMETDPMTQVEGMHRVFKKTVLRGNWLWMAGLTLLLLLNLGYLWSSPVAFLSSYPFTYGLLLGGLLWVMVGTKLAGYYLWLNRARREAQRGELTDTHRWSIAHRVVGGTVVVAVLLWLGGSLLVNHSASFLGMVLLCGVASLMGIWAVTWIRDTMRKGKAPRDRTETATAVASFALFVAILAGVGALSAHLGWFPANAGDSWWSQYPDGIPLTVEQLRGEVEEQEFWIRRDGEESLMLGQYQGWQVSEKETGPEEDMDTVIYTVTLVKFPALYNLCREEMLWEDHQKIDPAPWLAREAYRKTDKSRLSTYLLCYEECVVEISFGWEPTQEQMNMVGEKLGGGLH